ncbi:uncharacterized protein LOC135331544 [Halichondria panicea]|uniref:uncharacterized protein LOC135331544 n=1 Tax=Halichondria panicea TaxID=6063 RepID=UPI00312B877D
MDVSEFTSKERKQARKHLLKKIDVYNKQAKKTRASGSFPMTSPSKDLVYKGVVKVTYDRGYALQTKSLLVENVTTTSEAVEQLFDALGLRGNPSDYAMEEHNLMTGEIRAVAGSEYPLSLQLNHGPHQAAIELRLVQVRESRSSVPMASGRRKSKVRGGNDSDESGSDGSPNIMPKEEVIDHGIASVELIMEEALQDIPPLVHDIQERLKSLSETVAVDGKPRSGLPSRRLLWDILKPLASALVKDIRRLVDNGEFLANRHCGSPVVKLVATLILELITDHSRELVTVTKQMCGLRGAQKMDFNISVSCFIQQITYISKLVSKCNDSLRSMALTGHLLEVTSPDNFQKENIHAESYFTGSGSVSGVLLFGVVSAYLGLIRAAYEEKYEFLASLATNMLRSAQRALETIQKTDEYSMLHLHPLKSRVKDMELKLKVSMDNLIQRVKVASSSRPPPDAAPEMLLFGHSLIMATLDFLMVAQCASLVHKVVVGGWELLQLPWVRSYTAHNHDGKMDGVPLSAHVDRLSSLGSDSTSSQSTGGDSSVYYQRAPQVGSPEKYSGERKSRIRGTQLERERGDGMDAADMEASEHKLSFSNLVGMQAGHLESFYESENKNSTEVQRVRSEISMNPPVSYTTSPPVTDAEDDLESHRSTIVSTSTVGQRKQGPSNFELESSQYMGIDAVKKLRSHYTINKIIARAAESLLLAVTQKINLLSSVCQKGDKDKYSSTVDAIIVAAKQIREELSAMEVDILVSETMAQLLERTRQQMNSAVREVQLSALMASSSVAPESAGMKLMASAGHLKDVCSKTIADALSKVGEHKKAVEQAEKIEQEFVSLMTGQSHDHTPERRGSEDRNDRRKFTSPSKLALVGESDSDGLVFEQSTVGGGRGWAAKESPRVIGGTVQQLVERLTYHRVIDSEFTEVFMLTFYSFMTPHHLMSALVKRYNIQPSEELSSWEMETFETDIAIPVRLRVIQAVRMWITSSFEDFKNDDLSAKLREFIKQVQRSMSSCARQLFTLHEKNLKYGPVHIQTKPRGQAPTPLVPMSLSTGENFDLLDVNTLELARQLTLIYSKLLRQITPSELLSLGWTNEARFHFVPHIRKFQKISENLSEVVCREVLGETMDEDQASVLSYFIQTAKSCLDMKNYEAVFALVKALELQRNRSSWQLVTDHLTKMYEELKDIASPAINYHRYRQEIRIIHQAPCIPRLDLILSDLEGLDKDHLEYHSEGNDVINFHRCRQFAKVIHIVQQYQSSPYNLHQIEVMQHYLENLQNTLTDEELDKLSTKVEAFVI